MPGDVSWAKGVVPTPNGPLSVSWTTCEQWAFSLHVESPQGTSGNVSVPVDDKESRVFVDGKMAWSPEQSDGKQASYSGGYVTVQLAGGSHDLTVQK